MDVTAADPGLFGPGSRTWAVHGHPLAWVGGLRALYLQALHPEALRGVFTASDYRDDPWGRLMRTAQFVGTTSFGSTAAARAAGERVRAVHARLGVDDPHLLRWVHCCEVTSFLDVHRRSGGRIEKGAADEYLAEQARNAWLVGLDPEGVPADMAAMDQYFQLMRPELAAGREARAVARFLLMPPMPNRVRLLTPALPAWVTISAIAFDALPGWARRIYGLPLPPGSDLAVSLTLRGLRFAVDRLPRDMREGPQLRAARERLGAGPFIQ
ncbi:MAG TPA: oxygenase MpaB family protein [Sporichthyaceae bacterium]|nr:oxygenase MpaB family protein [Sporichthyaceae bacterium]